jgi:hypothetical protein
MSAQRTPQQYITLAAQHIDRLFVGAEGQETVLTPAAAAQAQRCLQQAWMYGQAAWEWAQTGDARQTHQACQAWYRATRWALQHNAVTDSAATNNHDNGQSAKNFGQRRNG